LWQYGREGPGGRVGETLLQMPGAVKRGECPAYWRPSGPGFRDPRDRPAHPRVGGHDELRDGHDGQRRRGEWRDSAHMVPAKVRIEIDLRVPDEETGRRLVDTVVTRQPFDPDVRLEIEGGLNRPPFLRSAGVGRLFEGGSQPSRRTGIRSAGSHAGRGLGRQLQRCSRPADA
jgi:hypothetical protein